MPSLCDICARPGSCCTGFVLPVGAFDRGTEAEVDAWLAQAVTCTNRDGGGSVIVGSGPDAHAKAQQDKQFAHVRMGLPFRRLYRAPDGRWRYWCPNLRRDGRCGDYENRPAVCHALQPGEGWPCCHYVPGIGACGERAIDTFSAAKRRKVFFFEKKNQKTFANAAHVAPSGATGAEPNG